MEIRIPRHLSAASMSKVRSKELIKRILKEAKCRTLRKMEMKGKPMEIEAHKILKNGRIHIKVHRLRAIGEYKIHIHFDKRTLFKNHTSLDDCKEVRRFVNRYVIPTILKHRDHYSLRTNKTKSWEWKNDYLPENSIE